MLDPHTLRTHLDDVAARLRTRGFDLREGDFTALDAERRRLIAEGERLKHEKNDCSEAIGRLLTKKKGGGPSDAGPNPGTESPETLKTRVRDLTSEIKTLDEALAATEEELQTLLRGVPNLPHASVPVGASEKDNRVERVGGEVPVFPFAPRPHWEIGESLGILDFERATKLAGARFSVLKGAGALLERSLASFMMDLHTRERGYTEILPPYIVNSRTLYGTGQLPKFEADLFKLAGTDYYLIPTAEVPVTNLHANEILDPGVLPLSYCAFTPCFRSEAGSYGKDVRGLIRQHQFHKVELVKITGPADSYQALEKLTSDAEEVLKRLVLPYRVVSLSTGDLGFSASKTYDLEVWLPGQGAYREISSCSNCEDFQARRANIRFRPDAKARPEFVHTLNGSGLAVGRTLIAILENYQQADGSVVVPEALRPYTGGLERLS